MTIQIPADLAEALRVYAMDNSGPTTTLTPEAAAIEILYYFLGVKP